MARNLSSTFLAQLAAAGAKPVFFVQIVFSNETIYLWSGFGSITWNGQSWTGMGWAGSISAIPETKAVAAQNIVLALSGIPTQLVTDALSHVQQPSQVTIWFGFLDASNNVIADPSECFNGHLDVPTLTEGGSTCTLAISAENPLVDLARPPNQRYTDCSQQTDFAGDLGMSFVIPLENLLIVWPQKA